MKLAEKIQGKRNVYVRVTIKNVNMKVSESIDFSYENLNEGYEANHNKLKDVVSNFVDMKNNFNIIISIADDEFDIIDKQVERFKLIGRKSLSECMDVELHVRSRCKWHPVDKYITSKTMHRELSKFIMDTCGIHMIIESL